MNLTYIWLLYVLTNVSATKILILKERARLTYLFDYEVRVCAPTAVKIAINIWQTPETKFDPDLRCLQSIFNQLESGRGPHALVEKLHHSQLFDAANWAIEYLCLEPYVQACGNRQFSSKLLLCAVAQRISGRPALHADFADVVFTVIESKSEFFFCLVPKKCYRSPEEFLLKTWACRPFIFSAALNAEIADTICNILKHKCRQHTDNVYEKPLVMFDPCCGSGTNLFSARRYVLENCQCSIKVD